MLPSSWHIGDTLDTLASDYAFGDRINVNSAYLMEGVGISGALSILAGILIIFTAGYLLIYNAFYISIAPGYTLLWDVKDPGGNIPPVKKDRLQKSLAPLRCRYPVGTDAWLACRQASRSGDRPHVFKTDAGYHYMESADLCGSHFIFCMRCIYQLTQAGPDGSKSLSGGSCEICGYKNRSGNAKETASKSFRKIQDNATRKAVVGCDRTSAAQSHPYYACC